jgi:uncharacterized membrane protein
MHGFWFIPFLVLGAMAFARHRRHRYGCHHGFDGGPFGGHFRRHVGRPFGYDDDRPGAFPGWGPLEWLLADLHLTPSQHEAVRKIVDDTKASVGKVLKSAHGIRSRLASTLRADSFDESSVGELLGDLDGSVDEARKHLLDTLAKLHEVLDPSQRNRLAEWLERPRAYRPGFSL